MVRSSWRVARILVLVFGIAVATTARGEEEARDPADGRSVPVRSAVEQYLLDRLQKAGGFQGLPGIGDGQGGRGTPPKGEKAPRPEAPPRGMPPGIGGGPPADMPGFPGLNTPRHRDRQYVVESLEFESEGKRDAWMKRFLELEGTGVLAKRGAFADVMRPAASSAAGRLVNRIEGVRWAEAMGEVLVPPPSPVEVSAAALMRGRPLPILRGGYREEDGTLWTGRGVTIAVLDDGVDFHHPDFIIEDDGGKPFSRVTLYWDVYGVPGRDGPAIDGKEVLAGPATWPDGSPIGVVYTNAALNRALRADTARGEPLIRDYLAGSHGTLCSSVAAGNGRASAVRGQRFGRYAGVAPDANLIAVRIFPSGDAGGDRGYLMNAIATWLVAQAEEKKTPLVVSCSWGRPMHGHDGAGVSERHLASLFPPEARGRALCVAAGNRGQEQWHASLELTGNFGDGRLEWLAVSPEHAQLVVYVETDDMDDITWQPLGRGMRPTGLAELGRQVNALTGHTEIFLGIPADGPGGLALRSRSGAKLKAHAYIYGEDVRMDPKGQRVLLRSRFQDGHFERSHILDSPACCRSAITVGSYDFNDRMPCGVKDGEVRYRELLTGVTQGDTLRLGRLSEYSSPGPLRAGASKPEVVAPGRYHLSSFPVFQDDDIGWSAIPAAGSQCAVVKEIGLALTADRTYAAWAGTSAATPYTAGVIALMLQKNPHLELREIRKLLDDNLSRERLKGNANGWGRGRLDLQAIQRIFAAIEKADR